MNKPKIIAPGDTSITRRQLITGATAAAAFQQLGCASPVPGGNGQGAFSGKTLQVQLQFYGQINSSFAYYFLINNSNSQNAPYPVPVEAPVSGTTYGNGFATANDGSSGGFTDFVLYSNSYIYPTALPNQGYALYHVGGTAAGGANNSVNFVGNGSPQLVTPPLSSGGNPYVIAFTLDLAQLFDYPNSTYNQNAAVTAAQSLTWIQINVVATNTVPQTNLSGALKYYDSFGNDSNGVGSYLNMNLKDGGTTYASNAANSPVEVPNDVWIGQGNGGVTSDYPSIDLQSWQILVGNN